MFNKSTFLTGWVFIFLFAGLVNFTTYASEIPSSDKEIGSFNTEGSYSALCISGYISSQLIYDTKNDWEEKNIRLTFDTTGFKAGSTGGNSITLIYSPIKDGATHKVRSTEWMQNYQAALFRTAQTERLPVQIKALNTVSCNKAELLVNLLVNVCSNEAECNK